MDFKDDLHSKMSKITLNYFTQLNEMKHSIKGRFMQLGNKNPLLRSKYVQDFQFEKVIQSLK